jgi:hypothetical protein
MLRTVRSEDELATVLAHEIGHVLAGHTQPTATEEASQILAQVSGRIAQTSLQGQYGALAGIAGVLVSEAVKALAVNPESQRQELEADHIGFFLMSDAGYDPRQALLVWRRMADDPRTSNTGSVRLLSTHPPTAERLEALEALLPRAESRYYAARGLAGGAPRAAPRGNALTEPDTFVIGKDEPSTVPLREVPVSRPNPAPYRRSRGDNKWVVVEPATVVRAAPRHDSEAVDYPRPGEIVVIRGRIGRWYEVEAPVRGYIEGVAISPR